MKIFSVLLYSFCLCSCAVRYGAVVGVQNATYNESASSFVSSGVEDLSYNNTGSGFHIGFSEESKYFLTKVFYFQNSYSNKTISFDDKDFDTSLEESGIRATVAWKLWFLQPYFSVTKYNSEAEINGESTSESYSAVGFGLDLEYEFSPRLSMYVGLGSDSYQTISGVGLGSVDHGIALLGIRYNFRDTIESSSQ